MQTSTTEPAHATTAGVLPWRPQTAPRLPRPPRPALHVRWARDEADVRCAQRLRWRVFVDEFGARPARPAGTPPGHEADLFDPFCAHLLVLAGDPDDGDAPAVGTCRLLTPAAAVRAGGYASEAGFDLTRLRALRPRLAEIGRTCVDPGWRDGVALRLLWSALAAALHPPGATDAWAIGSAGLGLADGGHAAADLWRRLAVSHGAPIERQVRPRLPLPVDALGFGRSAEPPALLGAYLRCGARVVGPPASEPTFACAELPLLLRTADLPGPLRRRAPAAT